MSDVSLGILFLFLLLLLLGFWLVRLYRKGVAQRKSELEEYRRRAEEAEHALRRQLDTTQFIIVAEHRVFLDGEKGSGKSALIAKLANPATDITKLRKTAGVAALQHTLCDQPFTDPAQPEKRMIRRHTLGYYDVPGERPQQLRELVNDKGAPDVLIFVVDGTNIEAGLSRFSEDRIVYLYGDKHVQATLKCSILYVSKSDIVVSKSDIIGDGQRYQIEQKIKTTLWPIFEQARLKPKVFFGSALTGDRLQEILGHIIGELDLAQYYAVHPSMQQNVG